MARHDQWNQRMLPWMYRRPKYSISQCGLHVIPGSVYVTVKRIKINTWFSTDNGECDPLFDYWHKSTQNCRYSSSKYGIISMVWIYETLLLTTTSGLHSVTFFVFFIADTRDSVYKVLHKYFLLAQLTRNQVPISIKLLLSKS